MWGAGAHDAGMESNIPTNAHKAQKNGIKSQCLWGIVFSRSESEGGWEGWGDGGNEVVLPWNMLGLPDLQARV